MNKTVVNFSCPGREAYMHGQERLMRTLLEHGETSGLFFKNTYPIGCPTHQQVPYAFKYFAMQEAFNKGADLVLWLDSSVVLLKPITPLWKIIEERGILVFDNPGATQARFTSKYCLDVLGCSLEKAKQQCQICGGVVGYNKHNELAMKVFNQMMAYAKDGKAFAGGPDQAHDAYFRGHRHDQSCLTFLVYEHNIPREPWPGALSYTTSVSPNTILELRGIV